jgi:hypothetical protein
VSIPHVKDAIRGLRADHARDLFDQCLRLCTASEVEQRVSEWEAATAVSEPEPADAV